LQKQVLFSMKRTLRCMKNEAELRSMKRGFATRRRLVCASLHANESERIIQAYRVLNICVSRCFIDKTTIFSGVSMTLTAILPISSCNPREY
jgi:hypothetical protein